MINKKILILIVLSIGVMTDLSAAHIRDIFSSGINATGDVTFSGDGQVIEEGDLTIVTPNIINSNGAVNCTFDDPTRDALCQQSNTSRVLANTIVFPPDLVNAQVAENTTAGTTITINPGNYSTIHGKKGTIQMNPGEYYVDELIFDGLADMQPIGTGTVIIYVQSTMNVSGSIMNCDTATGVPGTGNTSDKLVIYSSDLISEASQACIAGYLYLTGTLKNANMQIYGALSANDITLTNGGLVRTNLADIPFASIGSLGETGENLPQGWHIVGIPADLLSAPVTVADVFGDDNFGTYGINWVVYERHYDTNTYQTSYTYLSVESELVQGRGYWLGNDTLTNWKVFGLTPVVWDSSDLYHATNNPDGSCMSGFGCYTYRLNSCSNVDTSPYLYNLVGNLGGQTADWANFRIVVDGNITQNMTPDAAETANIISKTVHTYTSTGRLDPPVQTTEYTGCDDTGIIGDCDLNSTQGFWVEVNCTNSIGKTIDLIIPNGQ